MMPLLVALLLKALVVLGITKLVPGIRVDSFLSAVGVAVVYGLLSAFVKPFLLMFSLPILIMTLGLFALVINGFLLWVTDKLLESFEIEGFAPLALATLLLTVADVAIGHLV